jgi:hypothetical protein
MPFAIAAPDEGRSAERARVRTLVVVGLDVVCSSVISGCGISLCVPDSQSKLCFAVKVWAHPSNGQTKGASAFRRPTLSSSTRGVATVRRVVSTPEYGADEEPGIGASPSKFSSSAEPPNQSLELWEWQIRAHLKVNDAALSNRSGWGTRRGRNVRACSYERSRAEVMKQRESLMPCPAPARSMGPRYVAWRCLRCRVQLLDRNSPWPGLPSQKASKPIAKSCPEAGSHSRPSRVRTAEAEAEAEAAEAEADSTSADPGCNA